MKKEKEFIIFADDTDVIAFKVTTDDNYIVDVVDLFGKNIDFTEYPKLEEFEERYFQIDPYYWFRGWQTA